MGASLTSLGGADARSAIARVPHLAKELLAEHLILAELVHVIGRPSIGQMCLGRPMPRGADQRLRAALVDEGDLAEGGVGVAVGEEWRGRDGRRLPRLDVLVVHQMLGRG